ncbi:MAG TPA: type 1 glutamine amidotransferase [Tessaracoccus flavescens]|uniref:Type 1 glutamine amidotransferase n=1 Tax=Tessaracoccus flavescens TaxID=399497 RepID=A0A921EMM8_9ACTN|nr:type 1 glutamine amidotransferase [Tessaracoccus flavescens]
MSDLSGKKIAFLLTNGYEDSELTSPWEAVTAAGAEAVLIAPEAGAVEGKKGHTQSVDLTTADANAADYDALVLPGGVVNADHLRMDEKAVQLTKDLVGAGKPVGVICHGGWILTDAEAVSGKTMTSYSSLKTDLRNAGATWVDEEVVVDQGIISSRTPKDLPAFNEKIVAEFAR